MIKIKRGEKYKVTIILVLAFIIVLFVIFQNAIINPRVVEKSNVKPTLTLQASSGTIKVNDKLKLDVYAINFVDLKGVQLSINYNPDVLVYDKTIEGNFLNRDAKTLFFDIRNTAKSGLIKDIVIVRQGSGISGSGLVASVYFNATQAGYSDLKFGNILIADKDSNIINTKTVDTDVKVIP